MLRSIFVMILIIVGVYYGIQAPFYALLFYLANAYFRPEQWLWINIIPSNFSLLIGIYLVLATLFSSTRFFFNKRMALIGLLLFHSFFSTLLSDFYSPQTFGVWVKFLQPVVIAHCIVFLATDSHKLRQVFLILTLFLGLEAAKQGWVYLAISPSWGANPNTIPFLGDNNCVAVGMFMLLPIVVLMAQTTSQKWIRVGFRFMVVGILFRALSTYSRGGFLTCIAVGGAYWLRSRHKLQALLGMAIIVVLILPALSDKYWERIGTITTNEEQQDASASGRLHFWRVAVVMANAHPILGVGFNSYNVAYDSFDFSDGRYGKKRSVHSSFFGVLAETGYVGAVLYWLVIFSAFRSCHRVRKLVAQRPSLLALHQSATALETSLVAFLVGGSFVPFQYNEMLWHYVGFTIALEALASQYPMASASAERMLPDAAGIGVS